MVAAHHGYLELVQLLYSKGADLNAEDRFGQNVLWYCFGGTERHTQIVSFCLNTDTPVTPGSNLIGKPILVHACEKGNKARDVVELLVNSGCSVDEVAVRTGRSPLIEAARRGSSSVMQLLLQEGADADIVDYKQVRFVLSDIQLSYSTETIMITSLKRQRYLCRFTRPTKQLIMATSRRCRC